MTFIKKPLIAAALLALASTIQAQSNTDLQPITVYGSRFQERDITKLPQTNLISSTEIQQSGLTNIADVLKKIGNLQIRQDLNGNTNATIDMTGFGDAANNNVVVLLDGVRISENEQSAARISLIPVEAIEQIEITRGGNSVLYGDGANGGVINIITKKNIDNLSVVSGGVGGNNTYNSNLFTSRKFGDVSASIFGSTNNSKGYRDNNQTASRSGGGILQWQPNTQTVAGLRIFADEQDSSLPGSLPIQWLKSNPRAKQQSIYSEKYEAESTNITLFASTKINKIEYAIDLSQRNKNSGYQYDKDACELVSSCGAYPNSYATINSKSKTQQLNPRLKIDDFLLEKNKLTIGFDWLNWEYERDVPAFNFGPSNAQNKSSTKGVYFNSDWLISTDNRLTGGYRSERFEQEKTAFSSSGPEYGSDSQRITAHNIQYTKIFKSIQTYVKHGKNYRLPNADDNYQLTQYAYRSNSIPLKPQTSIDNEVGMSFINNRQQLGLSYYRSAISNEIGYDETIYGNNNYPSSKRDGFILNAKQKVTNIFGVRAHIQTINSKILSGTYAGKTLPGVSDYLGSVGLEARVNPNQIFDLSYRTVGSAYFSGDSLNTQDKTSKQHYVDLRYNLKQSSWDWTASINNALDKKQYDYGIYKPSYLPLYKNTVYPTLGRNFSLTGRYVF